MLRLLPATPNELFLQRERTGAFVVTGVIEGAREHVIAQQHALQLARADREPRLTVVHGDGEEVLDGVVQPSVLPRLLATLPGTAPFVATGTGQFQVALSPATVDAILSLVATLPGGCAEIRRGTAARRGKCTPLDDGAAQLERDVRAALDRRGLLQ